MERLEPEETEAGYQEDGLKKYLSRRSEETPQCKMVFLKIRRKNNSLIKMKKPESEFSFHRDGMQKASARFRASVDRRTTRGSRRPGCWLTGRMVVEKAFMGDRQK